MKGNVVNHCAICGTEIEPEEEFCSSYIVNQEPCPVCGQIICGCEVPSAD